MKKAFTLITLLFFSNFLFSQELHQAESFQLGSPIIGNQIYEASQYIQIQSGFGYSTQSNASFIAKTNPLLVVPPIEGKTGGPSGSDPALAGVFGAIVMDANVGENGNAIVTIPITVCPGISGIIPQLSIVYNSTGAESFIGKGWGLGGLSAITKVTKTKYYDNVAEAVLNTPEYETFALDGERLIWDETKQYYRTEFEKFAKITKVYDGNQIKFKVWTKDGSIIEYGYTNDSRQTILNLVGNSTTNAIAWHVNKISDIYGNSIDIKYLKDGGMCYPLEVQYSVTSINPDGNKIKFYYENQASISKYWFQGVNQEANYCETKKLLDSIEVYSNNSLFRKYGLKYITHGQLQKKFLESVTESNGDNEKLYPVKLNWQLDEDGYECDVANVDGFEMHDDNVLTDENFKTLIIPSNINDDILTDFYTLTSSALLGHERLYKYINTGSGYIGSDITPLGLFLYPYFYESQVYTVGDFNSDSKDDLVFVTGIAIPVYSGGFLTPEPTQVIERPQGSITQALTGDFNADGITDLMLVVQRRFIGIPPKCLIYFGSTNGLPTEPNKTVEFADTPIDASDVIVMVGDFNGDGVGDIYGTYYVSSGTFAVQRIFQYSNDNFAEIPVFPPLVFAREGKSEVQLGDFNGDMKSDILWIFDESQFNSNQNILLMLSYGNGFFNNSITNETYSDLLNAKSSAYIVSDFNNDGKTDFFQYDRTMPFINRMFTINRNGTSFEQTEISFPVFPSYPPSNQTRSNFIAGDFDGDGKIDLLNMFEESMQGFWPWQEDYKCSLNIGVSTKNKNNLLTKVTNSLCGETIFSYQYMTNPEVYQQARYDRELTPYPFNIFKGNLPLVLEKKISNGLGGYLVTKYKYLAGLTNVTGKGFAGFRVREAYDESSFITTSYYNEIFPDLGILVPRTINKSVLPPGATSATSISSTTISTSDLELGTGFQSHFLYSISTTTTDDINQIWKTEKMLDPDIYGNFTRIETHSGKISGRFRPEEHKTILTNTFDNITDGGKWILGRLVSSVATQTAANKTPITRNSSFTYYTNGRLESETVEPGNAKRTTKYYFYDNIGNITHSKITAPGLPDRHSYTEYDNENRFIDKIINNVGLTSEQLNFEPHGHPTLVKDANQNEFNYIYDKFGRLTKEILPTGIQSSKVYRWITTNDNDAPENAIYDTWEQTTGGTPTVVYYDNLARALRIVRIGFNGNKIFVDTKYDVRGRMERVSDPYSSGESILWTINTYDDYDRIIKTTRPGDIFDTYTFTPCKVVHANPLSQTTTSEVNSMGWVLSSTDADGINVKNEYNSGGFLTRTFIADASGNEIAATDISKDYDIFGNCITLNDRNLGDRAYVYNAFGELISSQKLLNSELTIYSYDGIGRMINRTEPGSIITTWQYDTKTKGKGMVDKITYPDNIEEYFYDNYSRPIQKNISIESVTYSYYNDYDPFGRALSITYPTGLIVKNEYNEYNFLSRVIQSDNNMELWKAVQSNSKGQLMQEVIGSNITTSYTYQPGINLTQSITSTRNGSQLQNWTFNWNNIGRLESRINNTLQKTELYDYDNLNRLIQYTAPGQPTFSVSYDVLGNISSKTDAGTYQYETTNPYKLLSINGSTSAISQYTQSITNTSFDKIASISENGNSLVLKYGYDHQRIKQSITKAGGVVDTRIYIGGSVEKNIKNGVISYDNYISGGNGLCAIITTHGTSSTNKEYNYILKDHLGSVQVVVDKDGLLIEELNYDPWGRRRNPITYAYISGSDSHFTDRGFTGHEHLDLFSLVNMNGRVYDPIVGRFLSPDILIQDASIAQGLNRFSYCLNNPLSLVDPSGHSALGGDLAQTAILTAVSVAYPPLAPVVAAAMAMGNVINNGGSFNNVIRAGEKTFVISGISMIGTSAIGGYIQGQMNTLVQSGASTQAAINRLIAERALMHGVFQGTLSAAQGGKFIHGFVSGAAASLSGDITLNSDLSSAERVLIGAAIGGTASFLTGGKFINGAATGAFVVLFNHTMHESETGGGPWKHTVKKGQNCYDIIREYYYLFDRQDMQRLNPEIDIFNGGKPLTEGIDIYVPGPSETLGIINYFDNPGAPEGKSGGGIQLILELIINSPHSPLYQDVKPGELYQNRAYYNSEVGYFEWRMEGNSIRVTTFVGYIHPGGALRGHWRGVYQTSSELYPRNGGSFH